jgi:hypothetical protein
MENFTPKLKHRYRLIDGRPTIELKLKTPNQLFDERDPAPFRERDLDDDAVQYILSSYRELPGREAKLSLYFAGMGDFEGHSDIIRRAIHSHFEYEGELRHRQLRDILKQGCLSLLIGLSFPRMYLPAHPRRGATEVSRIAGGCSMCWPRGRRRAVSLCFAAV